MSGDDPSPTHATLRRPRFDPSPLPDASYVLTVTEGVDAGKTFTFDPTQPTRILIGTGPACDLVLTDREVSRRHAALELDGVRLRIVDLGSTNGTSVDGVRVSDAFVQDAHVVRVGSTSVRVSRSASGAPSALPVATSFGQLLGGSTEMRRIYPLCQKLAASDVSVVIEGETGTGKEVLAESLHEQGPRAAGPYVVFDCTAVPPNLVESELFGHERGAFTGAVSMRRGVFEQAHGGTLLIDEIGDLDIHLQPKLLRAIERAEIRRIGGDRSLRVDVRILSATRRDLDHEVQAGRFRDDLFHRLAVARIELPPLRRRRGDVSLLGTHFCKQLGGDEDALPPALLAQWDEAPWPGNVRELRNAVARWVALGELAAVPPPPGDATHVAGAGGDIERILALNLPFIQARERMVDEFRRAYIERVLAAHDGNVARAAAASGIGRRYFQMLKAR